MKQVPADEVGAGDIAILAGFDNINIGDSILSATQIRSHFRGSKLKSQPLRSRCQSTMVRSRASKARHVTSRKILERLDRELLTNVSIRVEPTNSPETFKVFGRGELQLGVLIEQMRREGFEMVIGKPHGRLQDGERREARANGKRRCRRC